MTIKVIGEISEQDLIKKITDIRQEIKDRGEKVTVLSMCQALKKQLTIYNPDRNRYVPKLFTFDRWDMDSVACDNENPLTYRGLDRVIDSLTDGAHEWMADNLGDTISDIYHGHPDDRNDPEEEEYDDYDDDGDRDEH